MSKSPAMMAFLNFLVFVQCVSATIGVSIKGGVTHLYGNSFGVPGVNLTYDYIVVGGGTAGNTIAARLALDKRNYTVAVLDPGSFYEILNGNRTQVPAYDFTSAPLTVGGKIDSLTTFNLDTPPQAGYANRRFSYIQGMVFGGTSATNYMGYQRPNAGALDRWSELVGDDFWTWNNTLPAYKKSCNFTPPDYSKIDIRTGNISYDPAAFEPRGGPLQVSYGNSQSDFAAPLSKSMAALGFPKLDGLNSGKLLGYAASTVTIDPKFGTRSTSETSFLQFAAAKTSMKIYPNAIVEKVLFNSAKKATGVLVKSNNLFQRFDYQLNARKEVILSAGTWHSPQILMLSGIGPASTLRSHNISVLSDLPGVGQNEWDQPFVITSFKVNVTTGTQIAAGNPVANQQATDEFLNKQAGPLTSIGGGAPIGYEKFPPEARKNFSNSTIRYLESLPADEPDLEFVPLTYSFYPNTTGPNDYYLDLGGAIFSIQSRGNMTIKSASILDSPLVSPNWLLADGDKELAIAALKRIRQIMRGSGILLEEYFPPASVQTDAQILAWLQENMSYIYHPACTCKMGKSSDPEAVIDSRARVRGVSGLRVVDASAFPTLPPGQPQSTVYMFAEKIAESILGGN